MNRPRARSAAVRVVVVFGRCSCAYGTRGASVCMVEVEQIKRNTKQLSEHTHTPATPEAASRGVGHDERALDNVQKSFALVVQVRDGDAVRGCDEAAVSLYELLL